MLLMTFGANGGCVKLYLKLNGKHMSSCISVDVSKWEAQSYCLIYIHAWFILWLRCH